MEMTPLPGYTLLGGGYHAVISERGGALRSLRHGDRDLVTAWGEDEPIPYYSGTLLAPWPNRVAGGAYTFGGARHGLTVNEPERGHALHGLAADRPWTCAEFLSAEDEHGFVRLTHTVEPAPGYPFRIALEVRYALSAEGLTTTLTATNIGETAAPYGCGSHPWLLAGADVRDYELDLPASRVLLTDESLAPRAVEDVAATPYDFRSPRVIGDTAIDNAFTGLTTGRIRLRGPDGEVEVLWDAAAMPWVQICTGTGLAHRGLAVEPMTCPPDAFNSGIDLVVLKPGDTHRATWTIRG
ncbi:aldose 1-epimerase family protein [Planotetraspora sp. A-T 1434]|uniref:aldose 1-epimerase family protein n=1 Tax=Planotetraspora sp. A-T 1434 TaxID=2979219 RepID=UPI0021C109E5|nr:aldose 1-epimerase family protein [Planotetraspora sp. A-T 1434]MCT9933376.1 aldose 1-epimerase family protein [Planotetraspora sp. A-T 1434]